MNETNPTKKTDPKSVPVKRSWWPKRRVTFVIIGCGALLLMTVVTSLAYIAGYSRGSRTEQTDGNVEKGGVWTCSMHPQVRRDRPGKCPICFMDLIRMTESSGSGHPRELQMTADAVALAEIQTTSVERRFVSNTVRMVGKVDYDETRLAYITARVPGRLDRLFIDYTGVTVRKGDHLVELYSPDLIVAQQELIQTWRNYQQFSGDGRDELLATTLQSTEDKLRLLGLTQEQIVEIKQRGKPTDHITIYADIGGVVIHKNANEGMYVQTGTQIYTIADLSRVWVYMDAYESDLAWLRYGQEVEFTTETYPGEIFAGRIAFIDPMLNERTRTVKVRVNLPNEDLRLKPGMFVRAETKSQIASGGQVVDASIAGKWVSPHHPEIVRDGPGKCPLCGIDLVPAEELGFVTANSGAEPPLVIPATAPLLTGKRAVVYVQVADAKQPTFQGREVLLGQRAGDYYIVRHGLSVGERVVTRGNFKIDSALQIAAKPSMMNPVEDSEGHDYSEAVEERVAGIEVPASFRVKLTSLYEAYLQSAQALAQDDLRTARTACRQLLSNIESIDIQALDADGRSHWKTIADQAVVAALEIQDAGSIDQTRRKFQDLSQGMLRMVQTFGHAHAAPIYQFRCSMAFDNKGADWLQTGSEARNPYFGSEMAGCGEAQATFFPQIPLTVPDGFRRELAGLYAAYFELQQHLAADSVGRALTAAEKMRQSAAGIDSTVLDKRAEQAWLPARQQLIEGVTVDADDPDIRQLRARFEQLSLVMLGIVDNFGHTQGTPLYRAYCPMAFDNQGAPWLQAESKIANPYFGEKMLRCGSIQRVFEPASGEGKLP